MTEKRIAPTGAGLDVPDAWTDIRRMTPARIGLPRAGASLATTPALELRLAHARARDAVHDALDTLRLAADLGALGLPVIEVESSPACGRCSG